MGAYTNDLVKQIQTQKKPGLGNMEGLMGKSIIPKGSPTGTALGAGMTASLPPGVVGSGLGKIPQGLNPVGTGGPTTNFASINDLASLLGIGGRGSSYGVNAMNGIGQDGQGY